jgi:hypothetical protein
MIMTLWALMALAGGSRAGAQSSMAREETWVTNGTVNAIVRTADTVYIGGGFSYVGPNTGHGVPIDTTSGQPVATFPEVNGTVQASVSDGAGGWFIGGVFTQVGGVTRNRLAHILSDGTVDPAWNPNASGSVGVRAVSGSTVYVGGDFITIGGQARNRIVALDAATGNAMAWNPNAGGGLGPSVRALTVSSSALYAGGNFFSLGGNGREGFAQFDDAIALTVLEIAAVDETHVDVTFSEAMGTGVLVAANYTISGTGQGSLANNPDSVSDLGGNAYRLTWNSGTQILEGDVTITVANVEDLAGNLIGSPNSGTDVGGGVPVTLSEFVLD